MVNLKIYTEKFKREDLKYIPLTRMIYPFFIDEGNPVTKYSWQLTFEHYYEIYQSLFTISSLDDSEFAVLPYDWFWVRSSRWIHPINSPISKQINKLSLKFYQKVKEKNKRIIIFFSGDRSHESLPFKDAIIFREGLYQSRRKPSDFSLSAFSEDLVEHYLSGTIITRSKKVKPTVGFCGLAPKNKWQNSIKLGIYHGWMLGTTGTLDVSPYKGEILRSKLLNQLTNDLKIETNFIIRDQSVFLGGGSNNKTKLEKRKEYVKNMVESDYILCCRGSGNYSYRFGETLCMGRIPIFINTDCSLPYDFLIEWKNYCVWIEEDEIKQLSSKLLDFHNSLSSEDFMNLQYKCRNLWLKWLSPQGFFTNFYHHLNKVN